MKPVLEVLNLSVSWPRGRKVLDSLSFSIAPGELVGLIGSSGCGKSTLCLTLAGIIPRQLHAHLEGGIRLLGRSLAELNLPQIASVLGIVFQDPETQLFLPRVRNELAFGPENLAVPVPEIEGRIMAAARETGCEDLLEANPNELSGGQQQLVALTAVIAMAPKILILDEVTSQLDPESAQRIQGVITAMRQRGAAILMVEHNLAQLAQADRILVLKAGRLESAQACPGMEDCLRVYGDEG